MYPFEDVEGSKVDYPAEDISGDSKGVVKYSICVMCGKIRQSILWNGIWLPSIPAIKVHTTRE